MIKRIHDDLQKQRKYEDRFMRPRQTVSSWELQVVPSCVNHKTIDYKKK